MMSEDGRKAWALVKTTDDHPEKAGPALGKVMELDTEDPDVQSAAEVLVTRARAANMLARARKAGAL